MNYQPLIVKNPCTGKNVNIAPLFYLLEGYGKPGNEQLSDMAPIIDLIIRFLAVDCNVSKDSVQNIHNIFDELYSLRDAFEGMNDFK